jgi:hypothetical protein
MLKNTASSVLASAGTAARMARVSPAGRGDFVNCANGKICDFSYDGGY